MIRDGKESSLSTLISNSCAPLARVCRKRRVPLSMTFAAHFGIDPGTKQNHNGNVVPPAARPRLTPAGAEAYVNAVSPLAAALTKRLRGRRQGCGQDANRAAGQAWASLSSYAVSATATRKAAAAGNVALHPGEAFPRDAGLRRQRRNLRLRSRRYSRRGAAPRGRRRVEARLQPRACAARHRSERRLR